ncbi:endonuclease/exonuclease/phosphatase family protein [Kribbella sp. CA-247076]|uniref:endonuclease/exonuclease/phosphatase family protein n=1 Tax=Kribbella sp. CA-247076 TaxID=3239941 RepID=UPI003D8E149D
MQNPEALYGDWPRRRKALAAVLDEANPDLVGLVEAVVTDEYDQPRDLLGPDYHLAHGSARGADGAGITIASRWPIARVHELDLHVTPRVDPDFPAATVVAEIDLPDPIGPTVFACTNPSWQLPLEFERQLQAVASARFLETLADDRHVVLAGDFDATPEATSMRFWRGLHALDGMSVCYRDAWETAHPDDPGHTFTRENGRVAEGPVAWDVGRRIDYIMVRCGERGPSLDVTSCERTFDDAIDGVWASDHFGVVATFEPRASPEPSEPTG